jgi:hypothetical protein
VLAVAAGLDKASVRPDPGMVSSPLSQSRLCSGRQSGLRSTRPGTDEGLGFGPGPDCQVERGKEVLGKDGRGDCCKLAPDAGQPGEAPMDLSAEARVFMQQRVVFLQKGPTSLLTSCRDEGY